ncbi:unnamed protein product [Moneuplotes crassus]|uniref:Uncharacterized protein n=1 Tax=Euplotes crassus TaxID=5936 RepID=A0AAD1U452_EUPCR|nr:unnamed protein product [Moneuplotes crassus]
MPRGSGGMRQSLCSLSWIGLRDIGKNLEDKSMIVISNYKDVVKQLETALSPCRDILG